MMTVYAIRFSYQILSFNNFINDTNLTALLRTSYFGGTTFIFFMTRVETICHIISKRTALTLFRREWCDDKMKIHYFKLQVVATRYVVVVSTRFRLRQKLQHSTEIFDEKNRHSEFYSEHELRKNIWRENRAGSKRAEIFIFGPARSSQLTWKRKNDRHPRALHAHNYIKDFDN